MAQKSYILGILVIVASIFCTGVLQAEDDSHFSLIGTYNTPYNSESFQSNFGIGAAFRFWGIFNLNANLYTDIVTGGDNLFNLKSIEPLGLFSFGLGVKIPMAPNMAITGDLQRFYRGLGEEDNLYPFSSSWMAGVCVDFNKFFGMEFYTRRLYDFSDDAKNEEDSLIVGLADGDNIKMLGIGLIFYL